MRKLFNKKALTVLGVILALVLSTALFATPVAADTESGRHVLINTDTKWTYLDNGNDAAYQGLSPDAANVDLSIWTSKDYKPDSAYGWKTGAGLIGAKKGALGTINSGKPEQMIPTKLLNQYYADTTTNIETIFFRITVTVENIDDYEGLLARGARSFH